MPRKKRLLALFLKGDRKNIEIKHGIKNGKEMLVNNLKGNVVQSRDVTGLFRLYHSIGQDIFVPPHVKYLLSKKDVKVQVDGSSLDISLLNYLIVLSFVRQALKDFIHTIAPMKVQAKDSIEITDFSTQYADEQYADDFIQVFSPIYERNYPESELSAMKFSDLLDPAVFVDRYAKISHYSHKNTLIEQCLAGEDLTQHVSLEVSFEKKGKSYTEKVSLPFDQFLVIVKSLHISLHVFSCKE